MITLRLVDDVGMTASDWLIHDWGIQLTRDVRQGDDPLPHRTVLVPWHQIRSAEVPVGY